MKNQRGVALISVLLITTIIVSILTGIFYRQSLAQERLFQSLLTDQAALIGYSAEDWVAQRLIEDANRSSYDSLSESWAQALPPLPVENGVLSGRLTDLQSRVNLNRFTAFTPEKTQAARGEPRSDYFLIERLFRQAGYPLSDAQLDGLIDWQDPDDQITGQGAESPEYQLSDTPYRTANGELVALYELLSIQGFDSSVLERISPWVNVLPRTVRQINVNTAPAQVLMALCASIDQASADRLIEIRAEHPWTNVAAFYRSLAETLQLDSERQAQALVRGEGFDPITVSSDYFQLEMKLELGGRVFNLESVLHRVKVEKKISVNVISRSLQMVNETLGEAA
ncbi:type II secretion system minor pseudopilin GspK [Marinobacterium sp. YM272]|uniref:type II secretion system minor pseudopilin GspK n=1 Tax=Marinobacterium sp. YM272 TaxID=3421654 RepID=UPI003D7FC173